MNGNYGLKTLNYNVLFGKGVRYVGANRCQTFHSMLSLSLSVQCRREKHSNFSLPLDQSTQIQASLAQTFNSIRAASGSLLNQGGRWDSVGVPNVFYDTLTSGFCFVQYAGQEACGSRPHSAHNDRRCMYMLQTICPNFGLARLFLFRTEAIT